MSTPAAPPATFAALVQSAREARQQGNRDAALALLREALTLQPEHAGLPAEIADELRAQGHIDEADLLLNSLVARHPQAVPAWIGLAWNARRRNDRSQSLGYLQRALQLKPDHPTLPLEIAADLRELGRVDEAMAMLETALTSTSFPGPAWQQLGAIALGAQDMERALHCFEQGIHAQPGHPGCYVSLVNECIRIGLLERAEMIQQQGLIAAKPTLPLEVLGIRIASVCGQLERAISLARKLHAEQPRDFDVCLRLTELLVQTAAFEEAEQALTKLSATTTAQLVRQEIMRAQMARARFDIDTAILHAIEARRLDPGNTGARNLLMILQLMQGDLAGTTTLVNDATGNSGKPHGSGIPHLWLAIWKELRINPFAANAVDAARRLSPADKLPVLAAIQQEEPNHFGTALAMLVTLNQLGTWDRHTPLPDAPARSRIPRRIIQFWDSVDIPGDILLTMQSWPRANRGFEHQVFNDYSAAAFIAAECAPEVLKAFQFANHAAMRADIFRLAYLQVRGGIYADADDMCRQNITPWLKPGYDLLLLQEDIGSIGNNFLAAASNHPFISAALDAVVRNVLGRQGDDIWFTSGPGALTMQFCTLYANPLGSDRLPPGVMVRDYFHLEQFITTRLPRQYKQDERHWLSPKAVGKPLFRPLTAGMPVRIRLSPGAPRPSPP